MHFKQNLDKKQTIVSSFVHKNSMSQHHIGTIHNVFLWDNIIPHGENSLEPPPHYKPRFYLRALAHNEKLCVRYVEGVLCCNLGCNRQNSAIQATRSILCL